MDQPLAERLRPQNLDEFLGQNKILGEQSLLRKSLENDSVPSMIFWGPPGCGKTSLAHVIRQHTKKAFVALSAVASGVKEVKEVLADARKMKGMFKDTILFIDEIHRFNKGQQDALLGAVEDGTVTLIGATTENPGFEVNSALLSRCQLILFAPLSKDDLRTLIFSALRDHPRGLQLKDVEVEDAVVEKLIAQSDGDARFLLNQIEWIGKNLGDRKVIDEKLLEEFQYKKPLRYDKSGEEHYNLISALHKSVRGSDPDAALYWLHRMLQGGEDPPRRTHRPRRTCSLPVPCSQEQQLGTGGNEGRPDCKTDGDASCTAGFPQFGDEGGRKAGLRSRLPVRPRQPWCILRTGTSAQAAGRHRDLPAKALRKRKGTWRKACAVKADQAGKGKCPLGDPRDSIASLQNDCGDDKLETGMTTGIIFLRT